MPRPILFDSASPPQIEDLPHGLIPIPPEVRERVAQDKAKFAPEIYTAALEEEILNDWTLQYYFDHPYWYLEVLYRPTPQGPEVLAIGEEEILDYIEDLPLEEQMKLQTWMP